MCDWHEHGTENVFIRIVNVVMASVATDAEVRVRFPALPERKSSGSGRRDPLR
jgi:hypothetical protein